MYSLIQTREEAFQVSRKIRNVRRWYPVVVSASSSSLPYKERKIKKMRVTAMKVKFRIVSFYGHMLTCHESRCERCFHIKARACNDQFTIPPKKHCGRRTNTTLLSLNLQFNFCCSLRFTGDTVFQSNLSTKKHLSTMMTALPLASLLIFVSCLTTGIVLLTL